MSRFTLIHSKEARFTAKKSNKINLNDVKEIAHSDSLLESLSNIGVRNIKAKTFTEVSSIGLTGESKLIYYFKDDELFHFIDDGKVFDAKSEKDIERQIKARFRKGLWGDKESFYRLKIDDDYLMHHGVEGQRWGKRNGPPYPLERKADKGEKVVRTDNGGVKVVSKGLGNSSGLSGSSGSKAVSKQLKKEGKLPKNASSQNLDKWGKSKNTNILYISGTSGSGKSTVANNLKDKNTEIINLDSFFDNPEGPKSKDFVSFLDKINSEYKKLSLPKDQISINDWGKVAEKFENEIEQYGKDTFGRGKKVIVEGVQLLDDTVRPDKSYFKDKPFILINTNIITSTFRANQRDDTKFELSNIMDRLAWNKDIKNLKKENNLKHSEEEFLAHHGVLGQEWGKRHGPPYPLDSHISTGKVLRKTSETKFGGRDIEPSTSKPNHPINRDVKRCNAVPNNNNNCTYCCMAYELHRRGLGKYKATKDVDDGLSTEEIYNAYSTKFNEKDISYPSDSIFEDKNANVRELTFRDHSYKVFDADDLGNFLSNKYKEDARGVLLCPWASARAYGVESGHCISWELNNGKLTLIDPQENSVIMNPNRFLEAVECYDLVELRTDDKTISSEYLKKGGVR